jgi:hypothetical protein
VLGTGIGVWFWNSIEHPLEGNLGMQAMTLLPKLARGVTMSCRCAITRVLRPTTFVGMAWQPDAAPPLAWQCQVASVRGMKNSA